MGVASPLDGRCGTCARFVRVTEMTDAQGHRRRAGQCLLGVWPAPLFETNTCAHYIRRGTVGIKPRRAPSPSLPRSKELASAIALALPEDLLSMDADEFREVLRAVIREELGVTDVALGGRWEGGELVLKPGKEGTADKRLPLESFFHKIIMLRDKLRVLEQKINTHAKLSPEDKVQLQQYVTQCYGTLTTFNVLFADRADAFVGQKGERDD